MSLLSLTHIHTYISYLFCCKESLYDYLHGIRAVWWLDLAHPRAQCSTPTTKNRLIAIVVPLYISYSKTEEEEDFDTAMNTQMGSALPSEKLDRKNFAS